MKYIFIQIPSYRDPEIIPTILDCIDKADNPDRLRFGICWQRDSEDSSLSKYEHEENFNILTTNYKASRGVCWARHQIQKLYDGEDYILQLDSHHRFVQNWDRILLRMIKETGSDKPILSTYGTPYFTDDQYTLDLTPTRICYHKFAPQGVLLQKPTYIDNYRQLKSPERARFISGHFIFAPGNFINDVPYDPELYFHGEEISMAVRAYTNGYDLFHPNKLVLWHLYAKLKTNQHAFDHDPYIHETGPYWIDHEVTSVRRVRSLLNIPANIDEPEEYHEPVDLGKYGLGSNRTLLDYERYAGINFKLRSAQRETMNARPPPGPFIIGDMYDWDNSFESSYKVLVEFDRDEIGFDPGDCSFWYIGAHDNNNKELYRNDLQPSDIKKITESKNIRLVLNVTSPNIPESCTIWPYSPSKGWLSRTVKKIEIQ